MPRACEALRWKALVRSVGISNMTGLEFEPDMMNGEDWNKSEPTKRRLAKTIGLLVYLEVRKSVFECRSCNLKARASPSPLEEIEIR